MGLLAPVKNAARTGTNYAYATARVRAKKAQLLPRETYAKMLKMSIPEITQTIAETVYQDQVDELASRFSGIDLVESALNVNEEHTYAQVRHFVSGEAQSLVGAFLDRYNFRDVKVIMRGKHYGATQDEMLKELLIEDREEYAFLRALMGDDVQGVTGVIEALSEQGAPGRRYYDALKTAEAVRAEPTLSDYEDALDRAYYDHLLATIQPTTPANRLFLKFVEREVDLLNLLATLRFRRARQPWDVLEPLLVSGGLHLDMAALRRTYEASSDEDIATEVRGTWLQDSLDEALSEGDLPRLEIAARKRLMDFASGFSHMNPLSILPIIDFLLRKQTEVRNLRAIARGKEAGLSEETIMNMLIV